MPIAGCTAVGAIILFSPSSATESNFNYFSGVVYIVSGGLFFIAAVLGYLISAYSILNSRDKRRKSIAVNLFIGLMMFSAISVGKAYGLT